MNIISVLTDKWKSNFKSTGDGQPENPFILDVNSRPFNEASIDASNRLRVSQQITLGDYKQTNDKLPYFFDEFINGTTTTTYQPSVGGVPMIAGANSIIIRQTFQRHNYASGKSHLVELTFAAMHNQTNVTKRVGYYTCAALDHTDADGFYLESSNGSHKLIVAKRGTEKLNVEQSEWNVDKLDGSGPSGVTIDWLAFNVFVIDFLYLGGTQVRFGFLLNGAIQWVHKFSHANNFIDTIVYSPSLPIRYEIRTTSGTGGALNHICAQVSSEGSIGEVGRVRSFNTGHLPINLPTVGTKYAIMGIRLKDGYENISISPLNYKGFLTSNDNFLIELVFNPTVAGTFTYNSGGNGAVDVAYGTSANTVTNATDIISSGYGNQNISVVEEEESARRIGESILGVKDTLVVCITPMSTNINASASIKIRELI